MRKIVVTGGAGFIGSNLIEALLEKEFHVVCLDNLSTGSSTNIDDFFDLHNFEFVEGDILDYNLLIKLFERTDAVIHHAALGSVPRSIEDPILTNKVNINGTLNVFKACVDKSIPRVIYAASSSTYGDLEDLPKVESKIGKPISPYAVTKLVNEIYADVFQRVYKLNLIGLRYFNVFGPKQDPNGPYAAVIPLFIKAILEDKRPEIFGDGNHSRDFTFVKNVVQANLNSLEATLDSYNTIYNIAGGKGTSLNELVSSINELVGKTISPTYSSERIGDIKHSLADISKAEKHLNYIPKFHLNEGLKLTIDWYNQHN